MEKRVRVAALIGLTMTAAAPPPLTGVWSGDRVTLTLTDTGGSLLEDCASATLDAPVRRTKTGFSASGRREDHAGGPQRADVPPGFATIRLTGDIEGETVALTVAIDGGASSTYRLQAGRRLKRFGCY